MKAPICEFINEYNEKSYVRMHMPGHKGKSLLGYEKNDITEIFGADSLYQASGIIKESEQNASELFGSGATFYSCEGSSLSVRAMCYLAKAYALSLGKKEGELYALSTKNAHSSFVSAAVLLDFKIKWLNGSASSYLNGKISACELEKALTCVDNLPFMVYVTSPDYLGNTCDIKSLSEVCKRYGVPLIVDNAHGAYLRFLENDLHPITNGATVCCDSAHKTLPALTGGAYLHVSKDAPAFFKENAKKALSLFGSSSPSYLILASLDNLNLYLNDNYSKRLSSFIKIVDSLKESLTKNGYSLTGNEPLKITIEAKKYGYLGTELHDILYKENIACEFCDPDYLVMMLTPEHDESELSYLERVLLSISRKEAILDTPPTIFACETVYSPKEASFLPAEEIDIDKAKERVLSFSTVSCPPAVSVIIAGERFNESTVQLCKYYGINKCHVIKE